MSTAAPEEEERNEREPEELPGKEDRPTKCNGLKRITRAFQRQEALESRTTNNQGETGIMRLGKGEENEHLSFALKKKKKKKDVEQTGR